MVEIAVLSLIAAVGALAGGTAAAILAASIIAAVVLGMRALVAEGILILILMAVVGVLAGGTAAAILAMSIIAAFLLSIRVFGPKRTGEAIGTVSGTVIEVTKACVSVENILSLSLIAVAGVLAGGTAAAILATFLLSIRIFGPERTGEAIGTVLGIVAVLAVEVTRLMFHVLAWVAIGALISTVLPFDFGGDDC